jgi:hypothetical protein
VNLPRDSVGLEGEREARNLICSRKDEVEKAFLVSIN